MKVVEVFGKTVVLYSYVEDAKDPLFFLLPASTRALLASGVFCGLMSREVADSVQIFENEEKTWLERQMGKPVTYLDMGVFDVLGDEEIKAVIYHEEGHKVHRDIEEAQSVGIVNDWRKEARADAYALKYVSKDAMFNAIGKLIELAVFRQTQKRGLAKAVVKLCWLAPGHFRRMLKLV